LKNPLEKLIGKPESTCACLEVKVKEYSGKETHILTKDESITHTKPKRRHNQLLLGKDAAPNLVV
jgi:hypothetical protein